MQMLAQRLLPSTEFLWIPHLAVAVIQKYFSRLAAHSMAKTNKQERDVRVESSRIHYLVLTFQKVGNFLLVDVVGRKQNFEGLALQGLILTKRKNMDQGKLLHSSGLVTK